MRRRRRVLPPIVLRPTRRRRRRQPLKTVEVPGPVPPYPFAKYSRRFGHFLDLSGDGNPRRLAELGLPQFQTPEELARWLDVRLGTLAWLVHRFHEKQHPDNEHQAHYAFRWIRKRSGGWRLIEAPKPILKGVQQQILEEILGRVHPHYAAHGFVKGRSIITNAAQHTGQRVLVKLDLENFYANITFSRVVAIFRALGYCREAAIWLARLTTSAVPKNIPFPGGEPAAIRPFLPRHLPQGAPTSPALANLSAYVLDVRLSGLARAFDARYTRYADDLTFSGSQDLVGRLRVFLPLLTKIVRSERFRVNVRKRRVIRNNARQTVTGVVVNEGVNVSRRDYDRLKATLHNCLRYGATSQNRDNHDEFAAHLRGRVAHVMSLNANRGAKLLALYNRIRW